MDIMREMNSALRDKRNLEDEVEQLQLEIENLEQLTSEIDSLSICDSLFAFEETSELILINGYAVNLYSIFNDPQMAYPMSFVGDSSEVQMKIEESNIALGYFASLTLYLTDMFHHLSRSSMHSKSGFQLCFNNLRWTIKYGNNELPLFIDLSATDSNILKGLTESISSKVLH